MADTVQRHRTRAWWKRPPAWALGIAAVSLAASSFAGAAGWLPAIPGDLVPDRIGAASVSIIFAKPMLLVFGGLVVAGLVRAMPAQDAQDVPAVLTKGA